MIARSCGFKSRSWYKHSSDSSEECFAFKAYLNPSFHVFGLLLQVIPSPPISSPSQYHKRADLHYFHFSGTKIFDGEKIGKKNSGFFFVKAISRHQIAEKCSLVLPPNRSPKIVLQFPLYFVYCADNYNELNLGFFLLFIYYSNQS